MSNRTIFLSDVHGCLNELKLMIDKINPGKDDHIVSLGDLVDKGEDSAGVVKYCRELRNTVKVTLILGNHEGKHARYRKQIREGKIPKMKNAEEIAEITSKLSDEDISFLDSAVPYYQIGKLIGVHAGFSPAIKSLPSYDDFFFNKKVYDLHKEMTMVRYVRNERMVSLGTEKEDDQYWASLYDGRFGYAIYGHQPYTKEAKPVMTEHTAGIDLGCVFGGHLCAFESPEKYTLVKALDQYSKSYGE